MKRFDTFGEYMFDLLFAPLKKGRRAVNQFSIFFRVVGREFDDLKTAVFRVRKEANVASASAVMLPVHGQDREMPRLNSETDEGYRTRLSMKGIIASWAGTARGIRYALAALGYEHARVEPCSMQDPERWAEFIVYLGFGNANAATDFSVLYSEVQKVKEGSSKLAYFVVPQEPVRWTHLENFVLFRYTVSMTFSHIRRPWVRFDGEASFDGSILFDQTPAGIRQPRFGVRIRLVELCRRAVRFDGEAGFDGAIQFSQTISSTGISAFGILARLSHNTALSGPKVRLSALRIQEKPGRADVPHMTITSTLPRHKVQTGGSVTMDNWRGMDGSITFDGSYKFDAYLLKEEL